jgi:DNA-binding protein HU-beta
VNKAELIQALSAYYDGSKSEAARALNAVVETITYKTAAGEKVSITGFGVFEKVHRSARMVRNPRTGERKRAKATAVPRFRAGSDLKAYVSGAKKVPRATAKKAAPAKAAARTLASKAAVTARKTVAKPAAKKATTTAKRTASKR